MGRTREITCLRPTSTICPQFMVSKYQRSCHSLAGLRNYLPDESLPEINHCLGRARSCLSRGPPFAGVLGCQAGQDDVKVARSYHPPSAQRKCGGSLMIFIASAQAASDGDGTSTAVAIIGATIGAVAVITVGVLSYFTQRKQLREQGEQFRRQLDDTETTTLCFA